jgi:hypothetical protein
MVNVGSQGYGRAAVMAVGLIEAAEAESPRDAWDQATTSLFRAGTATQKKGCPRCAFLGLCEEGLVKGVCGGDYTTSTKNKQYAVDAVALLRRQPALADRPRQLWMRVMKGIPKTHNGQMDVVTALWKHGLIGE